MDTELLLLFPPLSEARFFPYLSLPTLSSFLINNQIDVVQRDLNMELAIELFNKTYLHDYIENHEDENNSLSQDFKNELASFLSRNHNILAKAIFSKEKQNLFPHDIAVRFVRQGVELLLKNSILKLECHSLNEILEYTLEFKKSDKTDLGMVITEQLLKKYLFKYRPKILGISIPFYSQLLPSLIIAKIAKKIDPSIFIVFGGPQITLRYESFLKMDSFTKLVDGLGVGDGEETLLSLVKYMRGSLKEKSEIPNFIWVKEKLITENIKISIKDLPVPNFHGLPIKKYLWSDFQLPLTTCIGCYWGKCAFCSYGNKSYFEKSYQQKRAVQIANECKNLIENYGVKTINFVDENTNLKLIHNSMKILNEWGHKINFSTRNRLEDSLLEKKFCKELKNLGCVQMSVGYETNSQRLLDLLNKGVNAKNYQKIIDNLHEVGIDVQLNIMGGLPTETEDEIKESQNFIIKNINKVGIDIVQFLVAEPKTLLSQSPENYFLEIHNSDILIGNQGINYGMGRMGYSFNYTSGKHYEERKNEFKNTFNNKFLTSTKGEHELPNIIYKKIKFYPWVKIIRSKSRINEDKKEYIIDFLNEKVYLLPSNLTKRPFGLESNDNSTENINYLQYFYKNEIGTLVE